MPDSPISIKRYPNRRYYASHTSKYVSLQEIEALVQEGHTIEIRDSQTGDDLTRAVLTQIIMERHPEKMSLFPTDMLHFILRSNDAMSSFLRDYFLHSLTYLDYLQNHSPAATTLAQPMHWVKAWLDGIAPTPPGEPTSPDQSTVPEQATNGPSESESAPAPDPTPLSARLQQIEERLTQIESKE